MSIKKQVQESDLPEFSKKIYVELLKVPKGKVTTYAALAHKLNSKAYRGVGQAMNKNPFIPDVPCHRVVASDGKLHGYAKGLSQKEKLLRSEGVNIIGDKVSEKDILRKL